MEKDFGKRLTKIREDKGLSLEEFAKEIGVSSPIIARWERSEFLLPMKTIIKIAKYFNVTIDYLLGIDK